MLPLSFCHARLPKAGLGNKLLVWAKAYVFSCLNDLPLVVSGWNRIHMAPLLRGGDLRLYWNYFKRTDQVGWKGRLQAGRYSQMVFEPPAKRTQTQSTGVVYQFSTVPPWDDYFGDIRDHRHLVRDGLINMLVPNRAHEVASVRPAEICVHARLGDFRKLCPNEKFETVGGVRTPLEYFRTVIREIRAANGANLPVVIVTDGSRKELVDLLDLGNVSVAPKRTGIADILVMSKSRILISSAGSTFSYWGGFLGDCALIQHPDHVHKPVRPPDVNREYYEGALVGPYSNWPGLVLNNIRNITLAPDSK
jgi:hypothetical protein